MKKITMKVQMDGTMFAEGLAEKLAMPKQLAQMLADISMKSIEQKDIVLDLTDDSMFDNNMEVKKAAQSALLYVLMSVMERERNEKHPDAKDTPFEDIKRNTDKKPAEQEEMTINGHTVRVNKYIKSLTDTLKDFQHDQGEGDCAMIIGRIDHKGFFNMVGRPLDFMASFSAMMTKCKELEDIVMTVAKAFKEHGDFFRSKCDSGIDSYFMERK